MKFFGFTCACVAFGFSLAGAVLDLPNAQPKVDAAYWNAALDSTWQGLIRRNIQPYSSGAGLIHRPKSETPGDAVSEGVGYGMLVALYANDQEHFNKMWETASEKMWQGSYHNWHMLANGVIPNSPEEGGYGEGAATDAEEDIALALIFADKLVSAGKWQAYTSPFLQKTYAEQAQKILDKMWESKQIRSEGVVAPGADWGGYDFVNPGYFSPAWYKIFAKFDKNDADRWTKAVDKSYEIISKSPGYSMGMVPDWMNPNGNWNSGDLGYNAYFGTRAFFKDAIRILWRTAIDAVWFDESRAKEFLANALKFINGKGGPSASNFYQIEKAGELLPADDKWTEFNDQNNPDTWRYRREHSHLTVGMWATAAMAVGESADRIAFSEEMGKFYEGRDYFGNAVDPTGGIEDTLHNEMYFDQFLAWFGTSLMSGAFVNVIDAIDNPKTNVEGDLSSLSKVENPADPGNNPNPGEGIVATVNTLRSGIAVERLLHGVVLSTVNESSWKIFDLNGHVVARSFGSTFVWNAKNRPGIYIVKAVNASGEYISRISIR